MKKTKQIEYVGWFNEFLAFSDCGRHPQFRYMLTSPPTGWKYTFSPKIKGDQIETETFDEAIRKGIERNLFPNFFLKEAPIAENIGGSQYSAIYTDNLYRLLLLDKVIDSNRSFDALLKIHFKEGQRLLFHNFLNSDWSITLSKGKFIIHPCIIRDLSQVPLCMFKGSKKKKVSILFYLAKSLLYFLKFYLRVRSFGGNLKTCLKFMRSRVPFSERFIGSKPDLQFVPSVPFVFGKVPWIIEIEDMLSFCFPFLFNGKASKNSLLQSEYLPCFKALLSSPQCRGVITHVKATKQNMAKAFQLPELEKKLFYIPIGITNKEDVVKAPTEGKVYLLFSNSWHQHPDSFCLRGGIDVLFAFEKLAKKQPEAHLIFRAALPKSYEQHLHRIQMEYPDQITIIDAFLPKDEWEEIQQKAEIYLLPSARIHVVSILEAMNNKQVVVTSDGWGISDYVQDEVTGIQIKGRYGKVAWDDEETGLLCENYDSMYAPDHDFIERLHQKLAQLVSDKEYRNRLATGAKKAVEEKYTLENWNKQLETVLSR